MTDGTIKTRRFREAKRAEGAARQEIYLPVALCEAIDAFKDSQRIGSRPEAIRRLCELGLKVNDLLASKDNLGIPAQSGAEQRSPSLQSGGKSKLR